jgi:hypothetical protein
MNPLTVCDGTGWVPPTAVSVMTDEGQWAPARGVWVSDGEGHWISVWSDAADE